MQLNIDPVIFYIAGYPILRWYSLAYILGFICAFLLFKKYNTVLDEKQTDSMFNYAFLGVILGGRLGYVVFYNFSYYISHASEILAVWHGGMSFHGGLIGVIIGLLLFCKKNGVSKAYLADIAPMCITPGLFFGRIANFINGELWGAETDLPIGFVFPQSETLNPRHPTQLYEAFTEGLIIFIITFAMFRRAKEQNGNIFAWFLIMYGVFRFIIEFVREPDSQLGYIFFDILTMGHILCLAMLLSGTGIILYNRFKKSV